MSDAHTVHFVAVTDPEIGIQLRTGPPTVFSSVYRGLPGYRYT